jgi:hypothetical protein
VTEPSKLIGNPNMGGLGVTPNPAAIAGAVKDAEAGATNRQKTITEDYQDLSRQNVTAQTVISRLQTIKQLGPQAITGAEAEKRDFFNGLLSLAGLKSAESAKTASDLDHRALGDDAGENANADAVLCSRRYGQLSPAKAAIRASR